MKKEGILLSKNIKKNIGKNIEKSLGGRKSEKMVIKDRSKKEIANSNDYRNTNKKFVKVKEDSKIFEMQKDTIVGIYHKNQNFGFVIPDDKKLGSDIYISKNNDLHAKDNQKVVAKITKLPKDNKSAEGKIIQILGYINQAGVDFMSLIKEYDLPYEFPEGVLEEAKKVEQKVSEKEFSYRRDLRKEEFLL